MSIEAMKRWVEIFGGTDWHDELVDSAWAEKANQAIKEMYQAIEQAQEPVAWLCMTEEYSKIVRFEFETFGNVTPLYTSPPQRQPLTDAAHYLQDLVNALDNAFISSWQSTRHWQKQLDDARDYLAAHGIKGEA